MYQDIARQRMEAAVVAQVIEAESIGNARECKTRSSEDQRNTEQERTRE